MKSFSRPLLLATAIIVGVVATAPAMRVTRTNEKGETYEIVVPDIVTPPIVMPDIRTVSIAEIQVMKPDVALAVILKAETDGILWKDTEKLSVLITKLDKKGADKVLQMLSNKGYFLGKERVFYDSWLNKDFSGIKEIIDNISMEQSGFFTAWGREQDFSETNEHETEYIFSYKMYQIWEMDYNWKDKFKPSGDFILVINYSISQIELRSLLELIDTYKNQIKCVILPYGSHRSYMNNYDNKDISTYKEIGEWADKVFYSVKEKKSDIPVYLMVSYVSLNMDAWIKSFKAKYDGIAISNVTSAKANFKLVYKKFSKYNKNLILAGMFGFSFNQPINQRLGWEQVKDLVPDVSNKIRDAGFRGVIWIRYMD